MTLNLDEERLAILKSLSFQRETDLIADPSMPGEVKSVLGGLQASSDAELASRTNRLYSLYQRFGMPMVKCVLEQSYLIHSSFQLDKVFGRVMEQFEKDVQCRPGVLELISGELDRFAHSPYEVTRQIVGLFRGKLARQEGALARSIENRRASFESRFGAAELAVAHRDSSTYPAILKFLLEICRDRSDATYQGRIKPCIELFSRTGEAGLRLAIEAFEKETPAEICIRGPFIIAAFDPVFVKWFLGRQESADALRPSSKWARVIFRVSSIARKLEHRDRLLMILLNDWSADPRVARVVQEGLERSLAWSKHFLRKYSKPVARVAREFVGEIEDGVGRVRPRIVSQVKAWFDQRARPLRNEALYGKIAVEIFRQLDGDGKQQFLGWLADNDDRPHFMRGFFRAVTAPPEFLTLDEDVQLRILGTKAAYDFLLPNHVDDILCDERPKTPDVRSALNSLLTEIARLAPWRDDGGLLS